MPFLEDDRTIKPYKDWLYETLDVKFETQFENIAK